VGIDEASQSTEGGIFVLPSMADFSLIQSGVVMLCCHRNGIMLRGIGLNNNPPRVGTAPRPPCYLAKELKGALTGTEVRKMKNGIGRDYPYQGDQREVKPLGYHLCADEDVRFVSEELI